MKITICAYDAPGNIDGPTAWLKRLLPFLQANGVAVRVIFIAANSKKLSFYNQLKEQGFDCVLIAWELFLEEKIIAILKDLEAHPPDVFVPNYFPAACYAAQWAKKAGIPSLIILHNDNDMHHALVDEFAAGDKDKRVSGVIAVSNFIKKKIDEKNTEGVMVDFITYGAPVPSSTTALKAGGPLKLIYAGRFTEHQKKISAVANAFCNAAREIPGVECVMYGAGEGLEAVLAILAEKGKGLPVRYGGVLKSDDVQQHFLQNHVYVLLSDYEGLPISLMEAMAAGLVPVCTDIRSGIGEVIADRQNGFLVKDRGHSFLHVIRELKNNPALWQSCSEAARKTIIENFSQDVCNKKWLTFLQKLASGSSYAGTISIPDVKALRTITSRPEFSNFDNRMPGPLQVPFYRLKKKIGRIKRNLFG